MDNLTPTERARRSGFQMNLMARGRLMTTDGEPPSQMLAMVQDAMQLADEIKPAKLKKSVYSVVTILAGTATDPRAIGNFTEVKTGKTYKVIYYDETAGDRVTWKFHCEAQRENYEAAQQAAGPTF
jgi:hypothetical protein